MKTIEELAAIMRHHSLSCNFAYAGTYGHECGALATLTASRKSDETKSGIYWTRRCESCAKEKGGENSGFGPFIPFNAELHNNQWK